MLSMPFGVSLNLELFADFLSLTEMPRSHAELSISHKSKQTETRVQGSHGRWGSD